MFKGDQGGNASQGQTERAQSDVLKVRQDTRSVSLLSLHGYYMNTTTDTALSCMVDVFVHAFLKNFQHT